MNKAINIKHIILKLLFLLFILVVAIFMVSCTPSAPESEDKQPNNVVDIGTEENKEEVEEPEEELILYSINNPLITYTKQDGLYFSYLDIDEEVRMHEGEDFNQPKISPGGEFIVYTFEGDLYGYNLEVRDYGMIVEEVVSYAFADDQTLIYSASNMGLTKFDMIDGTITHEPDDNIYTNLTYGEKNILYGKKTLEWTDDLGDYATNVGLVRIDALNLSNEIVVEGIKSSDDIIGYDPTIFKISDDGRYLYLMEKFESGSISADFGSLGVYDTELKKHTAFEDIYGDKDWSDDDLIVLPETNNLAVNPQNGSMVSVVKGGGREMLSEKELVILDIGEDKSFELVRFLDEELVAMTPSFSLDGRKLLYSATEALEPGDDFQNWFIQAHNIYEYNIKEAKISKLTEETSFDIMPISMGERIIFLRAQDDIPEYFSLISLENGEEQILIEDILLKYQFYGTIQTYLSMDLRLNSKVFN